MSASPLPLTPAEAWAPLPASSWNEAAARHLLQRIGFSAPHAELARALADGPVATLERCFARMPDLPKPYLVGQLEKDSPDIARRLSTPDSPERRKLQQAAQEQAREAVADLSIKWLQFASRPENSPAEKWLLFLQDVWVVGADKVKSAALIYDHQAILRRHALGSNVALAKAVSRSPAMIVYLDLQQSQKKAPNENFARELFELFTLGEGHYTENDIKQAARAFTGYRQRLGVFSFQRAQHDDGNKTIFGETGPFDGDAVIDLVFRQKAAGTFLPQEMARFYLTENPLPAAQLEALGTWWARENYDLKKLLVRFFSSRLFYEPVYRDNFIKSPLQFYLGLVQELDLSVAPLPRQLLGAFRQMGQMPFNPPNVRGWVGGRNWINSATLTARRQMVEALLHPLNEPGLNGDEKIELAAAYADGIRNFTLDESQLARWAKLSPAERARELITRHAPGLRGSPIEQQLAAFLTTGNTPSESVPLTRDALATLLQSPAYQLC